MKRYRQYELNAIPVLEGKGFTNIDVTRSVADWGADVFCEKDGKKYVGQVKMYGTSKTKISRKDVMELYGVMAYFDCSKAFFIYSGKVHPDALKVAKKLGIEWIYVDHLSMDTPVTINEKDSQVLSIDFIWENYIKNMIGKNLANTQGYISTIVDVDDAKIIKVSHNGHRSNVKKDWFKWILERIRHYGYAEAIDLRNEFHCQASSFVTLIFKEIPFFEVSYNPRTIRLVQK